MSIATKQQECLQPFRNKNNEQHINTIPKVERQQQPWQRKKSIDNIVKREKHVTKPKQLARQTPVVGIETNIEESHESEGVKSAKEETKTLQDVSDENDCIEQEDYQIYQEGQVNEFFNGEILGRPKSVSDICLVNDHYILVKMPDDIKATKGPNNQENGLNALTDHAGKSPEDSSQRDKRKLYRCLRTKRSRITRIAPIHEEPEDLLQSDGETVKQYSKLNCLKVHSCWKANEEDIEIYDTQTIIKKSPQKLSQVNQKNSQKSCKFSDATKSVSDDIEHPHELHTISGSLLKSSLQHQVSLHNYGCLKYNGNNNNNLDIDYLRKSFPPPPTPPPRRKCPRFESFYWLLRPFRGKYRKPKPKIQAVVYKTYFVKWTKPPDTLTHGYGVRTTKPSELGVSVLRRCRSAIF